VSKELIKVTTVCTDMPVLSFLMVFYHYAALVLNPCLNRELMQLA